MTKLSQNPADGLGGIALGDGLDVAVHYPETGVRLSGFDQSQGRMVPGVMESFTFSDTLLHFFDSYIDQSVEMISILKN